MRAVRRAAMALVCASAMAACTIPQTDPVALPQTTTTPAAPTTAAPKPTTTTKPKPTTTSKATTKTPARPVWTVGAHPLPRRADGYGEIQPTPAVLRTRSLPTTDYLPPPSDGRYHATVSAIPAKVLTRSTWQPGCPVAKADLRYLTMSFRGFDGRVHTGEMIVNAAVATKVTTIFGQLFDRRFPIEEMRVTTRAELSAPPTGDGNNTASFVCRPIVGQTNWSAHAYGLAVDLNPFINPYLNGDLVLPELASSYLDRSWVRPGMVRSGDAVVRAFAAQGFAWGGYWTRPKDLQHFTANGH